MKVVAIYSVKSAKSILKEKYSKELKEIFSIIENVDANKLITKESKEKTRKFKMLFSPIALNNTFKKEFKKLNWKPIKVQSEYSEEDYIEGYHPKLVKGAFREMDFVKNKIGVEVQFGKYAFMVYNVSAKMTIFHNLGRIDIGVEVVPVKEMQLKMSTGVSFFEQLVWDLKARGESNIDIPVLILGINP